MSPKKLFPRLSEKINSTNECLDEESFTPHPWIDFQKWFLKPTAHRIASLTAIFEIVVFEQ